MGTLKSTIRAMRKEEGNLLTFWRKGDSKIQLGELAKMLNQLPPDLSLKSFKELKRFEQVEVFGLLDGQTQNTIVKGVSEKTLAFLLNNIDSDVLLGFFSHTTEENQRYFLSLIRNEPAKLIKKLMIFPEESVARVLNTDFVSLSKDITIQEAFEKLRNEEEDNEKINTLYILDENGKLIDDMPIRRLVLNAPEKKIAEILDFNYVYLNITDTRDTAIEKFKEYDRVTLPVVDAEHHLVGIITADDIIDVMEEEDTEDAHKFGGMEELDFPYVKTPIFSLIRKRAGWLIILFIGEMLTATAMGYFNEEISKAIVLALFIPLIISSGGNSGSQAATLIIRAMALKEISVRDWWYVMRREIFSGLLLGLILGVIGFVRILGWEKLGWYDYGEHWLLVAVTIFFSLIGIVLWGTLVGSMIPIILKRVHIDPATSSAPFVATFVDVTGLIIYFTIAATILSGTLL